MKKVGVQIKGRREGRLEKKDAQYIGGKGIDGKFEPQIEKMRFATLMVISSAGEGALKHKIRIEERSARQVSSELEVVCGMLTFVLNCDVYDRMNVLPIVGII